MNLAFTDDYNYLPYRPDPFPCKGIAWDRHACQCGPLARGIARRTAHLPSPEEGVDSIQRSLSRSLSLDNDQETSSASRPSSVTSHPGLSFASIQSFKPDDEAWRAYDRP